ncbi:MAG: haloacid dehalogenase-like hydrolase [Chitinophagaceae bacterium]|nr:haloacid dehalogenase-like hydrolase [Chitinophagaceae bacterium]
MKKNIAFFDFDGTITYKDTLPEIIKYQKGTFTFYSGMIRLSPWLIAMKLKLISNSAAKQKLLTLFFGRMTETEFQQKCDSFISNKLPSLVRPGALAEIKKHQSNNTPVVIVSASPQNWLTGWCHAHNVACIATRLEVVNGYITGRIDGKNCYGEEKVNRINNLYNLAVYNDIFCYGDTKGDKPMLKLATFSFYKPFR